MASLAFDSFNFDALTGNIDTNTDTFYAVLTTEEYEPNIATHTKRSDVTNEVSGAGYTAGGFAVPVTVTKNTTLHRTEIFFGAVTLPDCTFTARKAVYFKRRGGAASADELVAVNDFGSNLVLSAQPLALGATSIHLNTPVAA